MATPTEFPLSSQEELKAGLKAFCERHGIARLEAFGSFVRGDTHPGSDLDLLATFRPDEHPGWDFFSLQEELEAIIGCKVDLLTRRSVELDENRIRRNSILQTAREIYAA